MRSMERVPRRQPPHQLLALLRGVLGKRLHLQPVAPVGGRRAARREARLPSVVRVHVPAQRGRPTRLVAASREQHREERREEHPPAKVSSRGAHDASSCAHRSTRGATLPLLAAAARLVQHAAAMSPPLHRAWRDYRNRQRAVLLALAGYLPLVRGAGAALRAWTGDPTPERILAAAWWTACVAAVVWFGSFRCPFCALPFHWTWLVSNPFSRRCLHCGFEKRRDPDAAGVYAGRR